MAKRNSRKRSIRIYGLIFAATVCVSFLLYVFVFRSSEKSSPQTPSLQTQNTSDPTLIIGQKNAPVTIVEYVDFKCPNCAAFHNDAGKKIRDAYIDTGKANIEVRAYPFLGPDSGRALRGAYCANEQGSFTDYHDKIFSYMWETYYKNRNYAIEIEDVLTEKTILNIIASTSIDEEMLKQCMRSEKLNAAIDNDLLQAADDSVQGTPTFIIDGQRIVGPQPFELFDRLLSRL